MKKIIPYLFLFIVLISFCYAEPPINSITNIQGQAAVTGLFFESYKYGEDIEFDWQYFNNTGYPKNINNSITCGIHIYKCCKNGGSEAGGHIFINDNVTTTDGKWDWEQKISWGNFTSGHTYRVLVFCYDGSEGAFYEQFFDITPSGKKDEDIRIFSLIFMIISIIIILLIVNSQLGNEHGILRIFFYYIIFILISVLPTVYFNYNTLDVFYKVITWMTVIFWIYISVYLIYWVIKKVNEWITKKNDNDENKD